MSSRQSANTCDVCVVFNEEAAAWKDYIISQLNDIASRTAPATSLNIKPICDDELLNESLATCLPLSSLLIVILSWGHVRRRLSYCSLVGSSQRRVVLLCGVDEKELEQFDDDWTRLVDIASETDTRLFEDCVLDVIRTSAPASTPTITRNSVDIDEEQLYETATPSTFLRVPSNYSSSETLRTQIATASVRLGAPAGSSPSSLAASPANSRPSSLRTVVEEPSHVTMASGFKLVPDVVRCEGTREVVVIFPDSSVACEEEVDVLVTLDSKQQSVVAHWLNNKTLCFTAPPGHDDDEATVSVRMRSGVNIGTSTLGYKSDVTIDVTQIYLRLLDSACSHVTSVDRSQLDAMLSAAIFQDDAQIPAKAFEVLFDSVSSLVAGSTCTELPTLLHLSAKHGLLDLSTNLLDLPNSDNARRLSNADGLSPAMLATRNGHTQLAAMLTDQESGDGTLTARCQEAIVAPSVPDRPKAHQPVAASDETEHYMTMNRCSPNTAVRGSNISTTSTTSSGIDIHDEEADVDDDVPMVRPILPPRRKASEPFIIIPGNKSCLHHPRDRRPSLDLNAFQHNHSGPSGPTITSGLRSTGLVFPSPATCAPPSSGPAEIDTGYVMAGSLFPLNPPAVVDETSASGTAAMPTPTSVRHHLLSRPSSSQQNDTRACQLPAPSCTVRANPAVNQLGTSVPAGPTSVLKSRTSSSAVDSPSARGRPVPRPPTD